MSKRREWRKLYYFYSPSRHLFTPYLHVTLREYRELLYSGTSWTLLCRYQIPKQYLTAINFSDSKSMTLYPAFCLISCYLISSSGYGQLIWPTGYGVKAPAMPGMTKKVIESGGDSDPAEGVSPLIIKQLGLIRKVDFRWVIQQWVSWVEEAQRNIEDRSDLLRAEIQTSLWCTQAKKRSSCTSALWVKCL